MAAMYNYPSSLDIAKASGEKLKELLREYSKAAYYNYNNGYDTNIGYVNNPNYRINRMYGLGQQDIQQYKDMLDCDDSKNETYMNIDWGQLAIATKHRDIIKGLLQKTGNKISCNAINKLAIDEKEDFRIRQEFMILFGEKLKALKQQLGLPDEGLAEVAKAKSLEELSIFMESDYKLDGEISGELSWDLVSTINDWSVLEDHLIDDLVDYGVAGTRDYIDSNNKVRIRRVDIENLIVGWSKRNDFKDAPFFGEVLYLTIPQCKLLKGAETITDKEWEQLEARFKGRYSYSYTTNSRGGDVTRIPVLDIEIEGYKTLGFREVRNAFGNMVYKKEEKPNKQTDTTTFKTWYKAKWIIDTDYIFDWGLVTNVKRQKDNMMEAYSNFNMFAPNKRDMIVVSLMERMIPIINMIHINWYKLQNAIARARPKGLAIELGGMEGVSKGDGETFAINELRDIYDKTGDVLYRAVDDVGKMMNNGQLPMRELENGMSGDVMRYIEIINYNKQLLYDVTGLNNVIDASSPKADVGKAQTQTALEASNNALNPIFKGFRNILERTAKASIIRVQDLLEMGVDVKGYAKAIGYTTTKFISISKDLINYDFEIRVESLPNEDDIMFLNNAINTELAVKSQGGSGGILFEDAIEIRELMKNNLKMAAKLLGIKRKQRAEEDQKIAQQNSEMNAKANQESIAMTNEFKQQMEIAKLQNQLELQKMKTELESFKSENSRQAIENVARINAFAKISDSVNKSELDAQHKMLDAQIAREALTMNVGDGKEIEKPEPDEVEEPQEEGQPMQQQMPQQPMQPQQEPMPQEQQVMMQQPM